MRYRVTIEGREREVDIDLTTWTPPGGPLAARVDGRTIEVEVRSTAKGLVIAWNGTQQEVLIHLDGDSAELALGSERARARVLSERTAASRKRGAEGKSGGELRAPMPGRIVRVLCAAGEEVRAGQPLVVVEAMKMENELRAPTSGRVAEVLVREGASIEGKTLLVRLEEAAAPT